MFHRCLVPAAALLLTLASACTPAPARPPACDTGKADCNGVATDACESILATDVANCGACNNGCLAPANGTATCAAGACGFTCKAGFGDCDGNKANGCEADLSTSAANCGTCGNECEAEENSVAACAASTCTSACAAGFGDCDGNATNGCEADLDADIANCGACGTVCTSTDATMVAACSATGCGFACATGLGDCDGNTTNGCERSVVADVANCGACGNACPDRANATESCGASTCDFACDAGFGDCDGDAANGCEVDLRVTAGHCGTCGNACPGATNATGSCAASTCGVTCASGFQDCDGDAANGCEVAGATSAVCGPVSSCALPIAGTIPQAGGTFSGSLSGAEQFTGSACTDPAGSDAAYRLVVPAGAARGYTVTMDAADAAGERIDSVVEIRADCTASTSVPAGACNDDGGPGRSAALRVQLAPGEYFVIAKLYAAAASGTYELTVTPWTPATNSVCEAQAGNGPTPLTTAGLANVATAGGSQPTLTCAASFEGGQLFYSFTLAPNERATVRATPLGTDPWRVALRRWTDCTDAFCNDYFACDTSTCPASHAADAGTPAELVLENRTTTSETVIVSVAAQDQGFDAFFNLDLATAQIPPPPGGYNVATLPAAACADMAGATTVAWASANSEDTTTALEALPFPMNFFGETATHIGFSYNGFAQLFTSATGGMTSAAYNATTIPSSSTPNGFIAPLWDDLAYPDADNTTSPLLVATTGSAGARTFVAQWTNTAFYAYPRTDIDSSLQFQLKLFEGTNVIEMHYCTMTTTATTRDQVRGAEATIGLESIDGQYGTAVSIDTAATADLTGYRLTPR